MPLKKVKKLFKELFGVSPIQETPKPLEKLSVGKAKRIDSNRKIDAMLATLNGEDKWFLCQQKRGG